MAKALETYFSELTDLQKAALARINDYKKELAEHGLYLRSSMELEFMTGDKHGNPMNYGLSMNHLFNSIKESLGPEQNFLEKFNFESTGTMGFYAAQTAQVPAQYELNISDPVAENTTPKSQTFRPEVVAGVTDLLRKRTLQENLHSTTNLSSINGVTKAPVYANFSPRPYRLHDFSRSPAHEHYDEVTSALHINVSLYDKNGRNLFALSPDLMEHCTRSLIELQRDAALPMLPTAESLWRIGANNSAPLGIGVSRGTNLDDHAKDSHGKKHISVRMIRESPYSKVADSAFDRTRIENRLPGADADPLVCMAITMAAMVDAVRQHALPESSKVPYRGKNVPIHITVDPTASVEKISYDLPKFENDPTPAHQKLIAQYENAGRIRILLGDEFYNAILHEYAKTEAVAAR